MAKEIDKVIKLQVRGGAANPSPPVGPALGAAGVNIMEFCKQFNSRTQDKPGKVLPVVITIYKDKSFDFLTFLIFFDLYRAKYLCLYLLIVSIETFHRALFFY